MSRATPVSRGIRDRPRIAWGERMSARIVAILGLIAMLSTSACAAARAPSFTSSDGAARSEAVPPAAPPAPAPASSAAAPVPGAAPAQKQASGGGAAADAQANQL